MKKEIVLLIIFALFVSACSQKVLDVKEIPQQESSYSADGSANIMHSINIQPVCEVDNENVHVRVDLAGDVDKVKDVVFNYKSIGSEGYISTTLGKQFSPDGYFYDVYLPYWPGAYAYSLEIVNQDDKSQTLATDSYNVDTCLAN